MKNFQLTDHFNINEFACKDGTEVPDIYEDNVTLLAKNLEVLRKQLGESVTVLSGYRTEAWNKKVGGKIKSKHLIGQASDLTVKSKTPKQLHAIIEQLIKEKKMKAGGLGLYPGFVHYDVRGQNVRW